MSSRIDLHWFRLDPDTMDVSSHLPLLSDDEVEHFQEFLNPVVATSFAKRRAIRRRILAKRMNVSPGDLSFGTNSSGKPHLLPPNDMLHFNASHGRFGGVVGVSEDGPIGVDIEFLRPIDEAAFADRILSPAERQALSVTPEDQRLESLFCYWTAKEALIKAMGRGLKLNLLPRMVVPEPEFGSQWLPAQLLSPLDDARQWHVWLELLEDVFARPAMIAIAAPRPCEVVMHAQV